MKGAMVVLAPGITRRDAVETNSLESYTHVGDFSFSSTIAIHNRNPQSQSTIAIKLVVTHPGRVHAVVDQHVIPAVLAWSFTFPTTLTVHQQPIAPHPIAKS